MADYLTARKMTSTNYRSFTETEQGLYALINGCKQNDAICQKNLYQQFSPKMLYLVRQYTGDREEAVSIMNNGFLTAFKKIASFEFRGSFEGWLRKIMVHAVADYYRNKTKEKIVEYTPDYAESKLDISTIDPSVLQKINCEELLALLNQLPQTMRVVVNMFIIEGYEYNEIATLLAMNEATCRWHVAEGRKKLKQLILTKHL